MGNNEYIPVKVDVETLWSMDPDEVFVQDFRKICRDHPVKYYKKVNRDLDLINCNECGSFFVSDEFDLYYNQHGCCPFCKNKDLYF
jgi:formylmethanofuran dehydrogenase subunit E